MLYIFDELENKNLSAIEKMSELRVMIAFKLV